MLGPLWEVEMSKKCTLLWCEARFEVKMYKAHHAQVEVEVSKKCTPLWREAHFEVKLMYKTYHVRPTLEVRCRKSARSCRCGVKQISKSKCKKLKDTDHSWSFCVAGARDCAPCQKWAKREGLVAVSTTVTTLHYTPLH